MRDCAELTGRCCRAGNLRWLGEQNEREQGSKLTVVELFRNGYSAADPADLGDLFVSLILLYFMISWLPSLLLESGLKLNEANLVTSMFLFAGTLGAICMAWFADRLKHKVRLLSGVLAGAALCTIVLGLNHDNPRYLVACVLLPVLHHWRTTDADTLSPVFLSGACARHWHRLGIGCGAIWIDSRAVVRQSVAGDAHSGSADFFLLRDSGRHRRTADHPGAFALGNRWAAGGGAGTEKLKIKRSQPAAAPTLGRCSPCRSCRRLGPRSDDLLLLVDD